LRPSSLEARLAEARALSRQLAREVVLRVREELREIANALDTGAAISPVPAIPVPPRPTRRDSPRRVDQECAFDDEEIPF